MDYKYSSVVPTENYVADGLSLNIPLRMHYDPRKEELGALEAQRDWSQYVSPLGKYYGGLAPMYSFIRVTVPECRPERLEIVSYANKFAFLYDGKNTAGRAWKLWDANHTTDEMEKLDLKNVCEVHTCRSFLDHRTYLIGAAVTLG